MGGANNLRLIQLVYRSIFRSSRILSNSWIPNLYILTELTKTMWKDISHVRRRRQPTPASTTQNRPMTGLHPSSDCSSARFKALSCPLLIRGKCIFFIFGTICYISPEIAVWHDAWKYDTRKKVLVGSDDLGTPDFIDVICPSPTSSSSIWSSGLFWRDCPGWQPSFGYSLVQQAGHHDLLDTWRPMGSQGERHGDDTRRRR